MERQLKVLETEGGRCPFEEWYRGLKDKQTRIRVLARLTRVQTGNMGDCKPVGQEVFELRLDFGPGYRIYFARHRDVVIVLLAGGDKRAQQKDIDAARSLWESNKHAVERFQRDFRG